MYTFVVFGVCEYRNFRAMIAAELRVGNILKQGVVFEIHCTDAIMSVDGLMASNKMPLEILEPIPLTPEILEQCGLVKVLFNEYLFPLAANEGSFGLYDNKRGKFFLYIYNDKGERSAIGNSIMHLHQLQNLFYSLTGKELTINIPQLT